MPDGHRTIVKPARLRFGDTLGIVAPASAPTDPKAIDRAIGAIEQMGFKVKPAPNLRKRLGFLAGNDRERAADLMRMFLDRKVKAILCLRGGYGTGRILARLDYGAIRRNRKILVGYSDLTALHCALLTKAGVVSFHGPMLTSDLAKAGLPEFTTKSFLRMTTEASAPGSICRGCGGKTRILRRGVASGRLVGGNLSLLCTTLATPYQPSFKGRVLFLEEVDEEPYRVDRMLTHLLNAGVLHQVAGIAAGIFRDCIDPKAGRGAGYRQTVDDVLRERLWPLGVPVVTGLPFGHVLKNATLPLGIRARLDGNTGDLAIEEAAVV